MMRDRESQKVPVGKDLDSKTDNDCAYSMSSSFQNNPICAGKMFKIPRKQVE
jgi:hypothetical protein